VKELGLLKSDTICQTYAQMKKTYKFFTHSVRFINNMVYIGNSVFMNADTFA